MVRNGMLRCWWGGGVGVGVGSYFASEELGMREDGSNTLM